MTGSGLPVSLQVSPSERLHFQGCAMGQRMDLMCVLQNLCPHLPVNFIFRKSAHFTTTPSTGKIPPRQCQARIDHDSLHINLFSHYQNPSRIMTAAAFASPLCSPGCALVFHCPATRELPCASEHRHLRSRCPQACPHH